MKKNNKIIPLLFLCILLIWGALSLGRTLYNFSKLYTEEKNWVFLSDDAKRQRFFGDRYAVIQFIKQSTAPSSELLIEMSEKDVYDEFYFLNIYYLFPRRVKNTTVTGQFMARAGHERVIIMKNVSEKISLLQKFGKYSVYINK